MDLLAALIPCTPISPRIPDRWNATGTFDRYSCLADIEAAIDRLEDESDSVIDALLNMPHDDPVVATVLLAGLRRLIFLCRGRDRELLNDLVVEVAIAIGELRRVRPARSHRRLAYVILDRARDRQRASLRRQMRSYSIDPAVVAETLAVSASSVEDEVEDRLRLDVLRAQVEASGDAALSRSWNSLLELVDAPRLSQAERDRWKYIRRRLSGFLGPDAA